MQRFLPFLIFLFLSTFLLFAQGVAIPVLLQTEHLNNPLGIDNPRPRFSWQIDTKNKNIKQTAYQIFVGTDSAKVMNNNPDCWNSGKCHKDYQQIVYANDAKYLLPSTKYFWKVCIWDGSGRGQSSSVNSFETGLMNVQNWHATWIDDGNDKNVEQAPYFRKKILVQKTIRSARMYVSSVGLFECYLNGRKVGNHYLDPMYTRFDKRNLYLTFDITSMLGNGENVVGVVLGNGWYNHQSKAVWNFDKAPWRNRPAFCMEIRITYSDGDIEIIPSDLSWKTSFGSLVFNSIYTGEHYDNRLEQTNWSNIGFDDNAWIEAKHRTSPSTNIVAQQTVPICTCETILAKSLKKIGENNYVFDFGKNMSGITKLTLKEGLKGTVVKLKHGERLTIDSHVDVSNIDVYYLGNKDNEPFQTDVYTLSGKMPESFMPKFNYKGFRYVELTSTQPLNLSQNDLIAYFVHSNVPRVGKINTSNDIINKIWEAANQSYLSNLMGYPTDCPQREKNGWTGDSHFAIESALYNFDGITVYEKWLADHRDEQKSNGVLPDIIPTGGWGYGTENGLDWTSSIVIIPWNLYLFYGDIKPLVDCYENIKRYVDYVDNNSKYHLSSWGRGDWVPVRSSSNKELTSSVYFYIDTKILAQTAYLLDKTEDFAKYTTLAENIRNAINQKFLNVETGIYASGTQTEMSVPLYWGVVPENLKTKVARNLAKNVINGGIHLDVGVLGAKALLNALSENGYADLAYQLASNTNFPSWGNWVKHGATTLLENWDLDATRDISGNHMMFGEISGWFFKGLGGIFPDPEKPGFKHILLRPNFVKTLRYFDSQHISPFGKIISKWEWKKNKLIYQTTIPANCTATLCFPSNVQGAKTKKLESGNYQFILDIY